MSAPVLPLLMLLALAPLAAAGSATSPEVSDPTGDCELAYGDAYLDVTGAWIEREDADAFDVALSLAAFDETLAEGAAYVVQFEHQQLRWGVVALFRPHSDAGWSFYSGQLDRSDAKLETFQPRAGSFDGTGLRVRFPKELFPHDDPDDTSLRSFWAASADLRPAYPFLLATDGIVEGSSDGRWLVCDEASSDAVYRFEVGSHAHGAPHAHDGSQPAADGEAPQPAAEAAPSQEPAQPDGARAAVPTAGWLAAAALLAAVALRRR